MGGDSAFSAGMSTSNYGTSCGSQTITVYMGDYTDHLSRQQQPETALEWLDRRVRELQVTL